MTYELSLAIPIYNEEACVEQVITELVEEFKARGIALELILVNNGSIDSSGEIIEKLRQKFPGTIKTIHLKKNAGIGGGVLAGMNAATGEFVGYTCSDGQITPSDTFRLFRLVRNGDYHIGKTVRLVRNDGIWRKFLSGGFWFMATLMFWNRFDDINGYPVMLKRELFKKLKIKSKSYMLNLELLLKARKYHLNVGDVEAPFLERTGGRAHVNLYTPLRFFRELIELKKSGILKEKLDL
ncbi:MAG: glycosyltransferase family 2 protein [archaeon]|nr:glycosyltransferase family 2 protein [archaeon]